MICILCHEEGADYITEPTGIYAKQESAHYACYGWLEDKINDEAINKAWMHLLGVLGAYQLQAKIYKLASWRKYASKYPYDDTQKARDIETAYELSAPEPGPDELVIMAEARDEYLVQLTPSQQDIARLTEQGYKPRDIAKLYGLDDSGSIRWQLWQMRQRLKG